MTLSSPPRGQRILWDGPMFGRLTKPGRQHLLQRGRWETTTGPPKSCADHEPLAFVWPNKSGPQFSVDNLAPAFVRPYPTTVTECVDDKLRLASLLKPHDIMPPTLDNVKDVQEGTLYFVKHRYGAQGKSVYVHDNKSLLSWWETCQNTHDFVIQQEVPPALDETGCKFVLRGHVLVYKCGNSDNDIVHAGLHQQVICLPHALPYEPSANANKSVHISQAGKRHPSPSLLADLPSSHPAAHVFPAIQACSTTLIKATNHEFDRHTANQVTCFALLGADYLVSSDRGVKLCEVNSHPALGWGSMASVPKHVFARLVEEMLNVLVFDEPLSSTGFVPLTLQECME